MKKTLALAAVILGLPLAPAFAASNTFEGTLTDAMCTRHHMMAGKSDAECVKACAKHGSDYVLVSGDKMYTLSAKAALLETHAGKRVVVHGVATGSKIVVASIEETPAAK